MQEKLGKFIFFSFSRLCYQGRCGNLLRSYVHMYLLTLRDGTTLSGQSVWLHYYSSSYNGCAVVTFSELAFLQEISFFNAVFIPFLGN